MMLSSAGGLLSLLTEDSSELKDYGINQLVDIVDSFWPEISDFLQVIESLAKDTSFNYHFGASYLTSKVYYYLGNFEKSLDYALESRDLFDISDRSDYAITIISKCIDAYKNKRVNTDSSIEEDVDSEADIRIERLIDSLFERSFTVGEFAEAGGMAIELRRMDMLQKTLVKSKKRFNICSYIYNLTTQNYDFNRVQGEVYKMVVEFLDDTNVSDILFKTYCLLLLKKFDEIAQMLMKYTLNRENGIVGMQVCFEVVQNSFKYDGTDVFEKYKELYENTAEVLSDPGAQGYFFKVESILVGRKLPKLHLMFIVEHNQRDQQVAQIIRDYVRSSVSHVATLVANGLMNCGTTSDGFLRNNADWIMRAQKWSKFSAVASIGVIHRGNIENARNVLQKYLPESGSSDTYSIGGALYAMGLMYDSKDKTATDYVYEFVKTHTSAEVRHGAALGLGLLAMGEADDDMTETLQMHVFNEDSITGEACSLAIGMINVGRGRSGVLDDIMAYASETRHDKITRGICIAIPMMMLNCGDEADDLVDELLLKTRADLRWSACLTLGLAYFSTDSMTVAKKLMNVAVTDVNNDVKRIAIMSLGYVFYGNLKMVTGLVSPVADSYNSYIRAGVAMAIGVSSQGVVSKEPLSIIEKLTTDNVSYVRQAAYVSLAMMFVQYNESMNLKVSSFRDHLMKVIRDHHEDSTVKNGAIVAYGIIDAGGRNVTIGLRNQVFSTRTEAVVGMLLFSQFWYWYPLSHMICLAFRPTQIHVLNNDLLTPNIKFNVSARPSQLAYPQPVKIKQSHKREKKDYPMLSAFMRQKKSRSIIKNREKLNELKAKVTKISKVGKSTVDKQPNFTLISNPGRILRPFLPNCCLQSDRFIPIKSIKCGGIIMAIDRTPEKALDININKMDSITLDPKAELLEDDEPDVPQDFEFGEELKRME